jgi:hypothetical protein
MEIFISSETVLLYRRREEIWRAMHEDGRVSFALRTIADLVDNWGFSFDEAVTEFFEFFKPEYAPLREKIMKNVTAEMLEFLRLDTF